MKRFFAVPEYMVNLSGLEEIPSNIAYRFGTGVTTSALAKEQGLESFDTALPRGWVAEFKDMTGFDPIGHFVWSLDDGTCFGCPEPVTLEGKVALKIQKHLLEELNDKKK